MELTQENITPKKAETWLNHNKSNRKLRDGVVEKYAADMKAGAWTVCPAPIAFYEDGDVADGQHRLWAIVESGTTQRFPIARGLPRDAGLNIDTGASRNLVDNARISGINTHLSSQLLSYARSIEHGDRRGGVMSNAIRLGFAEKHMDAAQWVCSNGPTGKGLRNAMLLGAIGRAWYHEEDKNKLKRFCDVITTGFSDGTHESAAIALRNYLLSRGPQVNVGALWRETFLKCQNAIHYFMRGKSLMVIKSVRDETYPLLKKRNQFNQETTT